MSKEINIQENDVLVYYLSSKTKELVQTVNLFLEFLMDPKEGYMQVTRENVEYNYVRKPIITGQMVQYVIRNILGTSYTIYPTFTNSYSTIFSKDAISSETDYIEHFYVSNMKKELKDKIKEVSNTSKIEYINESAREETLKYLDYLLNTIIKSEDDINRADEIIDELQIEGDNAFSPIDYGFLDDNDNILVGTFLWLFCGLEDWLENNVVNSNDIDIMLQLLLSEKMKSKYKTFTEETTIDEDEKLTIHKHLLDAFLVKELFLTNKAVEKLINVFYNITNYKGKDKESLIIRVKQFSNTI